MTAATALRAWLARHARPKVVSFDVFETVLWRLASPHDVVEREIEAIADALGQPLAVVSEHRHAFQRRMREAYEAGEEAEWNVREWLELLAGDLGLPAEETASKGLAAHVAVERSATRPSAGAAQVLRELADAGVVTVALSDSWSPSDALGHVLAEHGLAFDHVVSSGTERVSKRRGTTFAPLAQRLGVPRSAMLHVGDNWKADCLRPRLARVRALLVPRPEPAAASTRGPEPVRRDAARVAKALDLEAGDGHTLRDIGRELLAPLLAAMTLVVRRRFERDGIERVLFVARDAHLMHRAWTELVGDAGPPAAYVRLSRRALAIAHPDDLLGTGAGLAGRFSHRTAAGFLASFGLDADLSTALLRAAGLAADTPLEGDARAAMVQAIAQCAEQVAQARAEAVALLNDFVAPHVAGAQRLGIVDSGWAGTTQDVLAHVLDADRIHGVYLGVSDLGRPNTARSHKHGVLRDAARPQPWMNALDRTAGAIRLWDTLLREPHASVRGLVRDGDAVVPEFDPRTWPSEAQRRATGELVDGALAGIAELRPGFAWLSGDRSLSDDGIEAYCCACAARITGAPTPAVARTLLGLRYEEADGSAWSLGWDAVRDGRAWYPGLVASAGLRPLARAMEVVGRATRRR